MVAKIYRFNRLKELYILKKYTKIFEKCKKKK